MLTWDESRTSSARIAVNGLHLHVVQAGQGPLVLFLHGFPEFWYAWRRQLLPVAEAGFHAVAVDLRGYHLSDKPLRVCDYALDRLALDIAELIPALGAERAFVVGHDWGGGVAWHFAMRHPERLARLAILNAPHPEKFLQALRSWNQLRRSWYMFAFQLPWLPEWAIRRKNFAVLRRAWTEDPSSPAAFTPADVERSLAALALPGALTAGIHYYRAVFREYLFRRMRFAKIEAPVLVLWGDRDRYLLPSLAEPNPQLVPRAQVIRFPQASHWLAAEEPQRVSEELLRFFMNPDSDSCPRTAP